MKWIPAIGAAMSGWIMLRMLQLVIFEFGFNHPIASFIALIIAMMTFAGMLVMYHMAKYGLTWNEAVEKLR